MASPPPTTAACLHSPFFQSRTLSSLCFFSPARFLLFPGRFYSSLISNQPYPSSTTVLLFTRPSACFSSSPRSLLSSLQQRPAFHPSHPPARAHSNCTKLSALPLESCRGISLLF